MRRLGQYDGREHSSRSVGDLYGERQRHHVVVHGGRGGPAHDADRDPDQLGHGRVDAFSPGARGLDHLYPDDDVRHHAGGGCELLGDCGVYARGKRLALHGLAELREQRDELAGDRCADWHRNRDCAGLGYG